MKFVARLTELGCASYKDYLKSEHWKDFKKRYQESGRKMRCAVCEGGPIQLHHHTYDNLGKEELSDVTPLCGPHHEEVHALLKRDNKFVRETQWAISVLKGNVSQPQRRKKKRKGKRSSPEREAKLAEKRKKRAVEEALAAERKKQHKEETKRRRAEFEALHGHPRRATKHQRRLEQRQKVEQQRQAAKDRWDNPVFEMQAIARGLRRPKS